MCMYMHAAAYVCSIYCICFSRRLHASLAPARLIARWAAAAPTPRRLSIELGHSVHQ